MNKSSGNGSYNYWTGQLNFMTKPTKKTNKICVKIFLNWSLSERTFSFLQFSAYIIRYTMAFFSDDGLITSFRDLLTNFMGNFTANWLRSMKN